jgi:hypothetical protein
MAETAITVQYIDSVHGGELEDYTLTAADAANNMKFVNNGKTRLLIKNGHSSPLSVVVTSIADEYGRTGDLTITTTNAKESIAGPFPKNLFNQSDGTVVITIATDTNLLLAAISDA